MIAPSCEQWKNLYGPTLSTEAVFWIHSEISNSEQQKMRQMPNDTNSTYREEGESKYRDIKGDAGETH